MINELRQGSIINYIGMRTFVTGQILIELLRGKTTDDAEPIKLTEKWLLDLGFKYDSDSLTYDLGNFIINTNFENNPTFTIDLYCSGEELILETVHQLQNLYYTNTGGKELVLAEA